MAVPRPKGLASGDQRPPLMRRPVDLTAAVSRLVWNLTLLEGGQMLQLPSGGLGRGCRLECARSLGQGR
eukprot:3154130-Prymnesium_polylepis.1